MKATRLLSAALAAEFPADAARVLAQFPPADAADLLTEIDPDVGARVLAALAPSIAIDVAGVMNAAVAAALLGRLPLNVAAAFVRRAGAAAGPILAAMPDDRATTLRRLATYRANTAGALMDPSVLALDADTPIASAVEQLRANRELNPHYVYVIDRAGGLAGAVDPVDLAVGQPDTPLAEIATRNVARLRDVDDLVTVATHGGWNDWRSLPVVNRAGVFLGAVRHRTVRQIVQEEARRQPVSPFSLPLSLAELFWLGLAGFTEGLAQVVSRAEDRDGR